MTSADLVLTAEKSQVLSVVADLGGDFDATYTLPEYAHSAGKLAARHRGLAYMRASIPEVADPTGMSDTAWSRAFADIDGWCSVLATRLSRQVSSGTA